MYVEKGTSKSPAAPSGDQRKPADRKEGQMQRQQRLTADTIAKRLTLPIDDPERLF